MRAVWSARQEANARAAYARLISVGPTFDSPYPRYQLAADLGIGEGEVSEAVHWIYRMVSGASGDYIGSRRGPGGGYYVTNDRQQARDAEVSELKQMWSHASRMVGIVQQRVDTGLGNRAQMRRILASERTSLTWIEEALAEHGILIGSTDPAATKVKRVTI